MAIPPAGGLRVEYYSTILRRSVDFPCTGKKFRIFYRPRGIMRQTASDPCGLDHKSDKYYHGRMEALLRWFIDLYPPDIVFASSVTSGEWWHVGLTNAQFPVLDPFNIQSIPDMELDFLPSGIPKSIKARSSLLCWPIPQQRIYLALAPFKFALFSLCYTISS
jgi:hypothetical protein